jgi:indole-3-glycerol phosphate synthase
VGRFSQSISEGDGISVVPVLEGDVEALAEQAEAAGAEALAVWSAADARRVRARTSLPVLVREPRLDLDAAGPRADADAYVLAFERFGQGPELEQLHATLVEEGLDCAIDVRDEDELGEALERLDPEIILISEPEPAGDEDPLERALDLLADVPAGKLVVAEIGQVVREQVLALQRAGVDALIVRELTAAPDFSRAVEELVGGPPPR